MALALTNKLADIYKDEQEREEELKRNLVKVLWAVVRAPWKSSGLIANNAFTTSLVIRTCGFLIENEVIGNNIRAYDKLWRLPKKGPRAKRLSLQQIAGVMARDPEHFSINKYPPSAAVAYWFIDGVSRGRFALPARCWKTLCGWATNEFRHQRSLVLAGHDAMMDPVAMGMAACLCARLRTISERPHQGVAEEQTAGLPSIVELEHSVKELFRHQTRSGIWPKYFPLFHYQEAGSNFCFTFELLEAVLYEFGGPKYQLLADAGFIRGLEIAVSWCEKNRLRSTHRSTTYSGWNSGGFLKTLQKGQPESWPTAVVHMFLEELTRVLSVRIQQRLLEKYQAALPREQPYQSVGAAKGPLSRVLDINVLLPGEKTSLRKILKKEFAERHSAQSEARLRKKPADRPTSALLFGPPGTSKTAVTSALAKQLGWPMITINPSEFVKGSLENVYFQAEEIFRDLMDLSAVVVLFDEMDALTQSREKGELDTFTLFLTTSMLPKLTRLHDQGRVVFFMATNYQERFDEAIKRAGRFDFLICMGPPPLREKVRGINAFFSESLDDNQAKKARKRLLKLIGKAPQIADQLELFTFGDFKSFLRGIGNETNIGVKLEQLAEKQFAEKVWEFSRSVSLKMSDISKVAKRLRELDKPSFALAGIEDTRVGRYFLERRESRRQY